LKDREAIRNREQANAAEIENIRKVVVKYFTRKPTRKKAPFDFTWMRRLHREMFCEVWTWAGQLRTAEVNLPVAPPQEIETRLGELAKDLALGGATPESVLSDAAHLHHRALWIHPFPNGNGRWSRMLANIWLKTRDHPLPEWPDEVTGSQSVIREEYLVAVRTADHGDIESLLDLHRRFTPLPTPKKKRRPKQ
jgi:fido (protein-threonine AMPylation protein)